MIMIRLVKTPVIFITAYDEYAIQAFKVTSVDYLLKPIKKEELNEAFKKFKSIYNQHNKSSVPDFEKLLETLRHRGKKRVVGHVVP